MKRLRQVFAISAIIGILLLGILPTAVLANTPVNGGVSVSIGGTTVGVGTGGVSVGNSGNSGGGVSASGGANVGGNGGVSAGVDANVGGNGGNGGGGATSGGAASASGGANVGGNGGVSAGVDANVGGNGGGNTSSSGNNGGGSVAGVDANVSVGGNSGVNGNVNATVGGPNGMGGNPTAGVNANVTAGGAGTNSSTLPPTTVDVCVQANGSCGGATTTSGTQPVVTGNACVAVDSSCGTPATTSTTGAPPSVTGAACVSVGGSCDSPSTTSTTGTQPVVTGSGCVAVDGSCNGSTMPTGNGVGLGLTTTTPIVGGGGCAVVLDSCGTLPGGPTTTNPSGNPITTGPGGIPITTDPSGNPITTGPSGNPLPGGLTPGGPLPGGPITPGGPFSITVTGNGDILTNANVALNTPNSATALCTNPLSTFSGDATMTGTLLDCADIHISGSRAILPGGYGTTGDFGAAGASTKALGSSGKVLTDITGTCAGCDTAFGSGSGYRSFVQLKDQATGDFINVGIAHDASANATGSDPSALTLVIETGRKTGTGYDFSQGYITTTTNRVPGGHAQILLSWNAQGVTVAVNGVTLPNDTAPRAATVGTYQVRMSQPVVSFDASGKNAGDRVDTTFKSIAFG